MDESTHKRVENLEHMVLTLSALLQDLHPNLKRARLRDPGMKFLEAQVGLGSGVGTRKEFET